MSSGKWVSVVVLLTTSLIATSRPARSQGRTSLSCKQATTTRPHVGIAYSGDVSIDDYKLYARVPEGFTGWGGVANDAPFHGFTIFLDPSLRSCIVFEVHLRIDDDQVPVRPRRVKRLSLGDATAWQVSNSNHGHGPVSIATYFASQQNGQMNDGKVLFICPPEDLHKMRSTYDKFLNSVVFSTR